MKRNCQPSADMICGRPLKLSITMQDEKRPTVKLDYTN